MPYNDNRIWDSKRGWVKTKRGFRFNIRRHKPRCDVTEEELDAFLLAEDNPDFSIQGKASHLIVKAQAVIAHATGARLHHLLVQEMDKLRLTQPVGQTLRTNTRHQTRHGMRQNVRWQTTVNT